jgi:hypothetical protein
MPSKLKNSAQIYSCCPDGAIIAGRCNAESDNFRALRKMHARSYLKLNHQLPSALVMRCLPGQKHGTLALH